MLLLILIVLSSFVVLFLVFSRRSLLSTCLVKNNVERYIQNPEHPDNYYLFSIKDKKPYLDIDQTLEKYNKTVTPTIIENVKSEYTYVEGDLPPDLVTIARSTIACILRTINKYGNTNIRFVNFETIIETIGVNNDRIITAQFFTIDPNIKTSRKFILQFYISVDNNISINYLRPEMAGKDFYTMLNQSFVHGLDTDLVEKKANTLDLYFRDNAKLGGINNTLQSYLELTPDEQNKNSLVEPAWIRNSHTLYKDLVLLKKLCYTQEPCKYDLQLWDTHSVNSQYKLENRCNVINHSDRILSPDPYINPTLFSLPFPGKGTIKLDHRAPEINGEYHLF